MTELETEIYVTITSELSYRNSSVAGELKSDEFRSQVPERRINKLKSKLTSNHKGNCSLFLAMVSSPQKPGTKL